MKNEFGFCVYYIVTPEHAYTLVNWKEIEEWYKLPFFIKWFIKKPIKELNQIKDEKRCSCDNGIIVCPGCEGVKYGFGACAGCEGTGKRTCGKCDGKDKNKDE